MLHFHDELDLGLTLAPEPTYTTIGTLIDAVELYSAAWRAGIEPGDRVRAYTLVALAMSNATTVMWNALTLRLLDAVPQGTRFSSKCASEQVRVLKRRSPQAQSVCEQAEERRAVCWDTDQFQQTRGTVRQGPLRSSANNSSGGWCCGMQATAQRLRQDPSASCCCC